MKKSSILWIFLLAAVTLAPQRSDTVGEMGGFVESGGGITGGRGVDPGFQGGFDSVLPIETVYSNRRIGPQGGTSSDLEATLVLCLFAAFIAYAIFSRYFYDRTSLMMVQVAIRNSSPEIQHHLSQSAKRFTNSTYGEGLSCRVVRGILSDSILHVLPYLDRCVSAASSLELIRDRNSWKRRFEKMCIEQREKTNGRIVEQNVGNQVNEFVVVTVLVAAFGAYKLPAIHSLADLKKAFSCLQSPKDIAAVKVFWTPPDGSSQILEEELVEEFLQLRPLKSQRPDYKSPTISFKPPPSASVSIST